VVTPKSGLLCGVGGLSSAIRCAPADRISSIGRRAVMQLRWYEWRVEPRKERKGQDFGVDDQECVATRRQANPLLLSSPFCLPSPWWGGVVASCLPTLVLGLSPLSPSVSFFAFFLPCVALLNRGRGEGGTCSARS
jgi:hypothetical protein